MCVLKRIVLKMSNQRTKNLDQIQKTSQKSMRNKFQEVGLGALRVKSLTVVRGNWLLETLKWENIGVIAPVGPVTEVLTALVESPDLISIIQNLIVNMVIPGLTLVIVLKIEGHIPLTVIMIDDGQEDTLTHQRVTMSAPENDLVLEGPDRIQGLTVDHDHDLVDTTVTGALLTPAVQKMNQTMNDEGHLDDVGPLVHIPIAEADLILGIEIGVTDTAVIQGQGLTLGVGRGHIVDLTAGRGLGLGHGLGHEIGGDPMTEALIEGLNHGE